MWDNALLFCLRCHQSFKICPIYLPECTLYFKDFFVYAFPFQDTAMPF